MSKTAEYSLFADDTISTAKENTMFHTINASDTSALKGQEKVAAKKSDLERLVTAIAADYKKSHKTGMPSAVKSYKSINPCRINAAKGKDGSFVDETNICLAWIAYDRGYKDSRWMTAKQVKANGGVLKDGSEAQEVPVFWSFGGRSERWYGVYNMDLVEFPNGEPTAFIKAPRTKTTTKKTTKAAKSTEADQLAALQAQVAQLTAALTALTK